MTDTRNAYGFPEVPKLETVPEQKDSVEHEQSEAVVKMINEWRSK